METDFIKNIYSIKATLDVLIQQNDLFNFLLKDAPQLVEIFHNYYLQNTVRSNTKTSLINVLSNIDIVVNEITKRSHLDIQPGGDKCLHAAGQLLKTLEHGLANKWDATTKARWLACYKHLYNSLVEKTTNVGVV